MQYWLFKSEPDVFSIDDLKKMGQSPWDGVRNYQARNYMMQMKVGDQGLFYHSRSQPPEVVGLCEVVETARPDPSAWDPEAKYYDPKCKPGQERWFMVEVRYLRHLKRTISLSEIKENKVLSQMEVARKGSRLSITPVRANEWKELLKRSEVES